MIREIDRGEGGRTWYETVHGTSVRVTDSGSSLILTLQQLRILKLVLSHLKIREIARSLGIKPRSVQTSLYLAIEGNKELLGDIGEQRAFYLAVQAQIRGWLEDEFILSMEEHLRAAKGKSN